MIDPKPHTHTAGPLRSGIHITISMREPTIDRLQEFLSLRGGEDLKFLCSLHRHIVVHDLALKAGVGGFLVYVMVNGRDQVGGVAPKHFQFLNRTFPRNVPASEQTNPSTF